MKSVFLRKRSARYARERMKLLLVSERIECSPQMMKMLRNDLIHSVKKYVTIDEDGVVLRISQEPVALYATIPVRKIKE
jgi:cell division topological specificity factor